MKQLAERERKSKADYCKLWGIDAERKNNLNTKLKNKCIIAGDDDRTDNTT